MTDISRKNFLGFIAAAGVVAASPVLAASPRVPAAARQKRNILIRGADLLTMDRKAGDLPATDVLIRGGRIAAIGKNLPAGSAEIVDGADHILMPGMVDGHRHVWEALEMGEVTSIRQAGPTKTGYETWKFKTMVCYTPDDAHFAEYLGGLQAIESGVTGVVDYCHIFHTPQLAEGAARGLIDSGITGTFCYQVSHTPSYGKGDTVSIHQARADRLAIPDEQHWLAAENLRRNVFNDSDLLKFGLATSNAHYGNRLFADFVQEFERLRRFNPHIITQHYSRKTPFPGPDYVRDMHQYSKAGLLGPDYLISHGNGIPEDELALLAAAKSMISASPMGEIRYPEPAVHARARRAGVPIGISTDAPLAMTQDYFDYVRSTYFHLFRTAEDSKIARTYGSDDVLHFATGDGTASIRLGDEMGRVAVGQRADLLLLRTDRLGFSKAGTLSDRVVNFAKTQDIDSVWINGVARKRGGKMLGVNWAKLNSEREVRAARLAREAATVTLVGDAGGGE